MDLNPFKLDIDELLNDFTQQGNSTTLTDMKRVWLAKKFSHIYEARPRSNSAIFMQSLFSHSIGHMCSSGSLSQRLGGLYCLYCLYETQPKPYIKIYLSLGELKMMKSLVLDAKENGIQVVPALVKRMLDENMFLFGSTDICSGSEMKRVDAITKLQDKHLQTAYEKLLVNTGIEEHVHMNLSVELGLESFKKMSKEYAKAKQEAIKEASNSMNVNDIKHIADTRTNAGDMVEELVGEWDAQKEAFYKQTGNIPCYEMVSADDEGFAEVERLLDG